MRKCLISANEKTIVALLADTGERYITTALFELAASRLRQ
jgi:hypothetical protein